MNKLREIRQQQKITQAELAKLVGISQQAIHKFENGEASPSIKTISKIAEVLNESIDNLYKNQDDNLQVICVNSLEREVVESLRKLKPEIRQYILHSLNIASV